MNLLVRLLLTFVSGVSSLYFVFWIGSAILMALHLPFWVSTIFSLGAAAAVARYVWRTTASVDSGLVSSVLLGAFGTGGIGFAAGFFGPIIFMPGANQGPLLGIFITGPLGFLLGAIGGAVHWLASGRHRTPRPPGNPVPEPDTPVH